MGVNFFLTINGSRQTHENVTLSHLDEYDLIPLVIVTMININSDKITSINYKIDT